MNHSDSGDPRGRIYAALGDVPPEERLMFLTGVVLTELRRKHGSWNDVLFFITGGVVPVAEDIEPGAYSVPHLLVDLLDCLLGQYVSYLEESGELDRANFREKFIDWTVGAIGLAPHTDIAARRDFYLKRVAECDRLLAVEKPK